MAKHTAEPLRVLGMRACRESRTERSQAFPSHTVQTEKAAISWCDPEAPLPA